MTGILKSMSPGAGLWGAYSGCVALGKSLYSSKPQLILLYDEDSFIYLTNVNQMTAIYQAPFKVYRLS